MELAAVQPLSYWQDWNNVLPKLGYQFRVDDESGRGAWYDPNPEDGTGRVRFEENSPVDRTLQDAPSRFWTASLADAGYVPIQSPEQIFGEAAIAQYGEGQRFSSARDYLDYRWGAGSQIVNDPTQGFLIRAGDPSKAINATPVAWPFSGFNVLQDVVLPTAWVTSTVLAVGDLLSYGLSYLGAEGVAAPPSLLDRFFTQSAAPFEDAVAIWNAGEGRAPVFDLMDPATASTWTGSGVQLGAEAATAGSNASAAFTDFASEANEAAARALESGYTGTAVEAAGSVWTSPGVSIEAPSAPTPSAGLDLASEANEAAAQAFRSSYGSAAASGGVSLSTLPSFKTAAGAVTSGTAAVRALTGGKPMNPIQTARYGSTVPPEGMQGGTPSAPNPMAADGSLRTVAVAVAAGAALIYLLDKSKG